MRLAVRWGDRPVRLMPVVPVREMEAWLLADGDALRAALRVRWTDAELGVPSHLDRVERIVDPKVPITLLMHRMSRSVEDYFERVAEEVTFSKLRQVPAFGRWWKEASEALVAMGFRRYP